MPRYTVRMEFNVISTDYGDIIIDADTEDEARAEAVRAFDNDKAHIDYYQGKNYDTELCVENKDDWMVTEHE